MLYKPLALIVTRNRLKHKIYNMSTLLELREKLNLTQEELANKANISVRTIQRIEAGSIPKGFTLEALS